MRTLRICLALKESCAQLTAALKAAQGGEAMPSRTVAVLRPHGERR